jgi:hypothetical protein
MHRMRLVNIGCGTWKHLFEKLCVVYSGELGWSMRSKRTAAPLHSAPGSLPNLGPLICTTRESTEQNWGKGFFSPDVGTEWAQSPTGKQAGLGQRDPKDHRSILATQSRRGNYPQGSTHLETILSSPFSPHLQDCCPLLDLDLSAAPSRQELGDALMAS